MLLNRRLFLAGTTMTCFAVKALPGTADAAGSSGRPILTMITRSEGTTPTKIRLNRHDFTNLGLSVLETQTPWTEGVKRFEGVWGHQLLAHANTEGTEAIATAINDYSVSIPVDDFVEGSIFFAISVDGKPLTTRTKGPVWAIYPFSDNQSFLDPVYQARAIWQLKSLEFK